MIPSDVKERNIIEKRRQETRYGYMINQVVKSMEMIFSGLIAGGHNVTITICSIRQNGPK
jgi:hypothetical protein